jgi:hypothetical protein
LWRCICSTICAALKFAAGAVSPFAAHTSPAANRNNATIRILPVFESMRHDTARRDSRSQVPPPVYPDFLLKNRRLAQFRFGPWSGSSNFFIFVQD